MNTRAHRVRVAAVVVALTVALVPGAAAAAESVDFVSPLFGLSTDTDGTLLVADAGAGIVKMSGSNRSLFASLPGVSGAIADGNGGYWAITGEPPETGVPGAQKLFQVSRRGETREIADLLAFEQANDPAGADIQSNPVDVALLGTGSVVIADAAANAVLQVKKNGRVQWVATLPTELASTANAKSIAGCPNPPAELAFLCSLPAEIPTEPVPTAVAVDATGAIYVSELRGFPAPAGASRVWRIEPGARNVRCGVDPECSVVLSGLTSIIDIEFGPAGELYVVELDEASWLAVELGVGVGGTVNRCAVFTGQCEVMAGGLPIPSAVTYARGKLYATVFSLVPGLADVIEL